MVNPANPVGAAGYLCTSGPPGTPSTSATRAQQWWINHGNTSDPSTQLSDDPAQWGLTWDEINAALNKPAGQTAGPNMGSGTYPTVNIIIPPGQSPIQPLPASFDWTALMLAKGGKVPKYFAKGGPNGSDTIPAWLTPGEFVVNAKASQQYGGLLNGINSGNMSIPTEPVYGGTIKPVSVETNYDGGDTVYNINVNVSSNANPNDIAYAIERKISRNNQRPVRGY